MCKKIEKKIEKEPDKQEKISKVQDSNPQAQ